jgi:hypothetical protein
MGKIRPGQEAPEYYADSGSANAYAITAVPPIAVYAAGQKFSFSAAYANSGASTLAVNGLTATAIKKLHDQDLASGDIEAGQIVEVEHDGTVFQMLSQLASATAGGAGTTTQALTGASNFTVPASINLIWVTMCGAGGSGGGGTAYSGTGKPGGGGGGAGATIQEIAIPVTPGQVIAYSVPASNAGGASGVAGTDGGNCSFGPLMCLGGKKGNVPGTVGTGGDGADGNYSALPGGVGGATAAAAGAKPAAQASANSKWEAMKFSIPGSGGGAAGAYQAAGGAGAACILYGNTTASPTGTGGTSVATAGGGGGGGADSIFGGGGAGGNGVAADTGSVGTAGAGFGSGGGGGAGAGNSAGKLGGQGGASGAGTIIVRY